ncbi:MAG: nickel/cobalt transporter, partial [Candidatus Rokuibacteriota bacterium]
AGAVGAACGGIALLVPALVSAHPLGNFSISHYAGLRLERSHIELRYIIDMAEIPTFQEIQGSGIVAAAGHSSLPAYVIRTAEVLTEGLTLTVNGRRLPLARQSTDVMFPPGAGGLPTLRLGIRYETPLDGVVSAGVNHLRYHDGNFPSRAGWKEVVVAGGSGIRVEESSVPGTDRSRELAEYPTEFLDSPPQDLEARVSFAVTPPWAAAGARPPDARRPEGMGRERGHAGRISEAPAVPALRVGSGVPPREDTPSLVKRSRAPGADSALTGGDHPVRPDVSQQSIPRGRIPDLITTGPAGYGMLILTFGIAASLGAFHALEPGHGKTVVAAYLVGARGTGWHALVLGLVVTASHTAGVYLLGGVTLYASRYVVPERLYPWLGVISGLTIAVLGVILFLRRYAGLHPHGHAHDAAHTHDHDGTAVPHAHGPDRVGNHGHDARPHPHPVAGGTVSLRELMALGISGGIVPCPAALVVLLSAVALRRVGFGLLLIVAFSMGLAAVLVAIGLVMVYARRLLASWQGDGPVITRWLPLTSSVVVTLLGVGIALQALVTAGVVQIRLG